jgi:hypothetical protein
VKKRRGRKSETECELSTREAVPPTEMSNGRSAVCGHDEI